MLKKATLLYRTNRKLEQVIFDAVNNCIQGEESSTSALKGSTEEDQFQQSMDTGFLIALITLLGGGFILLIKKKKK